MAFDDGALLALLEGDPTATGRAARILGGEADRLPLTKLDEALLELRRERRGDCLGAFVICPACEERLELELSVATLLASLRSADRSHLHVEAGAWQLELRPPTVADLHRAASEPDSVRAAEDLGRGCVVSARRGGSTVPVGRLPRKLLSIVEERLAEFDPIGRPLELTCPSCRHEWTDALDLTELVVGELEADARALLTEVHALARAYGWSESEIVSLPAARRREYVSMVVA